MSSKKHTPGPWSTKEDSSGYIEISTNNQKLISLVTGYTISEQEANANLIAAAPELLEACEDALALLFNGCKRELVNKLQKAIQKAQGE